jgi:DNA mismatch endonuclease (patch repair protein)
VYVIASKVPGTMDIVNSKKRSEMMAAIKSKNTGPEMIVRRFLHANGFRYRLHLKQFPGKPDLMLPKYGAAVFIHGCFWHHHTGCRLAYSPSTNTEKWEIKFRTNQERDRRAISALQESGWRVLVVWECGLRRARQFETLNALYDAILHSTKAFEEIPKTGATNDL